MVVDHVEKPHPKNGVLSKFSPSRLERHGQVTENLTFQAESSTTTLSVEFVDSRHAGRRCSFLA
jgi:hypothetical protein